MITWRRVAAFAVDWLIIIAYAAALVPLGIALGDRLADAPVWALNGGAFLILVVPATIWLAAWERGAAAATPGKRLLRLRVVGPTADLGWGRATARNALKLALPWELGHTGVYALSTNQNALGIAATIAAYAVIFVYLGYAFATSRTPYDRITRTRVQRRYARPVETTPPARWKL
jgi:uncharacterized RDD family membrane protein YckC